MNLSNSGRFGVALLVGAIGACSAGAQDAGPPSRGKHLGLGVGLMVPRGSQAFSMDPALWVTASIRIPVRSHLWLEPEVGYWQRSDYDLDNTLSNIINVDANLLYAEKGKRLEGWMGIGLGLGLYHYEGFGSPFTEPLPRVQLLGGVDSPLSSRATLFAAARLDLSDFAEWKVYAGLRWRL